MKKRKGLDKPLLNHICFQGKWTDYAVEFLRGIFSRKVPLVAKNVTYIEQATSITERLSFWVSPP